MTDDVVWLDGNLVPRASATVSVLDHGLTVGDGVFETMKVLVDADGGRRPFALTRHLHRLRRSAECIRLSLPMDDHDLRGAIAEVLAANPDQGRVRITVTGGPGPPGSGRGDAAPTVLIVSSPVAAALGPAAVVTVPWRRNEHGAVTGAKTTSYAENVVALQHATDRGADEAIFANTAGQLCEGTGSNVFMSVGGRLVTPPLSSGCLAGVTLDLVVELLDVEEVDLPLAALARADEAFLTSSTRDVQPIATVDGGALASVPGPATQAAAAAFADLVARTLDP